MTTLRYLTKQQREIAERLMTHLDMSAVYLGEHRADGTRIRSVDLAAVRQLIEQALRDSFAAGAAHAMEIVPTQIVVTPEQFAEISKHADGPVPAVWPFAPPVDVAAAIELARHLAEQIRRTVQGMHAAGSAQAALRRQAATAPRDDDGRFTP